MCIRNHDHPKLFRQERRERLRNDADRRAAHGGVDGAGRGLGKRWLEHQHEAADLDHPHNETADR